MLFLESSFPWPSVLFVLIGLSLVAEFPLMCYFKNSHSRRLASDWWKIKGCLPCLKQREVAEVGRVSCWDPEMEPVGAQLSLCSSSFSDVEDQHLCGIWEAVDARHTCTGLLLSHLRCPHLPVEHFPWACHYSPCLMAQDCEESWQQLCRLDLIFFWTRPSEKLTFSREEADSGAKGCEGDLGAECIDWLKNASY